MHSTLDACGVDLDKSWKLNDICSKEFSIFR